MAYEKKPLLKILLLGDMCVGKTSLMDRYVNQHFRSTYKATIGTDFCTKQVLIDDRIVTMQIWDTAGQERFRSLSLGFYRGADCCVLVFDVSSPASFKNLQSWRDEFLIQTNPRNPNTFPFVVLGNKADLDDHKISQRRIEDWCMLNNNIPYYETSAKNGSNVEKAFEEIIKKTLDEVKEDNLLSNDFTDCITIDDNSHSQKKCCCT